MWTWDEIKDVLTEGSKHPRPSWENFRRYSIEILDILSQFQLKSNEKGWQPILAMGSLEFLNLHENIGVKILREESGLYLIYKFSLITCQTISIHKVELNNLIDEIEVLL